MSKTLPTLDEFLAALPADRRNTMTTVHRAIRKAVPKLAPFMTSGMGPSPLIAYGKYHYKSEQAKDVRSRLLTKIARWLSARAP